MLNIQHQLISIQKTQTFAVYLPYAGTMISRWRQDQQFFKGIGVNIIKLWQPNQWPDSKANKIQDKNTISWSYWDSRQRIQKLQILLLKGKTRILPWDAGPEIRNLDKE